MKYRTDFVTNSSSSSFVIDVRCPVLKTKEEVYQYMKKLFREWLMRIEVARGYSEESEEYRKYFEWLDSDYDKKPEVENGYGFFNYIKSLVGIDLYFNHMSPNDIDWLYTCETYDEFIKYFEDNYTKEYEYCGVKHHFTKYLFKIIDFETCSEDELRHISSWYVPCIGYICNKDECDFKYRSHCEDIKNAVDDNKLREILLKYFGKWCIYVEEGSCLPEFITERLEGICGYFCGHMG